MEQYEIFITDKAFVDMEQIYEYIAGQLLAPQTALHQYRRIAEEILSLNIFPERIRQIDRPRTTQHPNTRMMRVDNYVVFFYIENHTVIVADVLYGASNLQN